MEIASGEQLREIRSLAERKLSDLKGLVPAQEYERLLRIAMNEIAEDFGILIQVPNPE